LGRISGALSGAFDQAILRVFAANHADINGDIMNQTVSTIQREGLSISEACAAAGIGRTKLYQAITAGNLKARKCGKRTLVLRDDLRDFLASLPGAA
jgi:excisionase family DNA binding protein